jgi:nicotinic acid mononucleotide adenylyltransferase/O-acetyl-ADP-ribose deacetylase (regulator of RNase III)
MADSDPKTKGQKEERKEKDAIEKYNVGTLKMYISPEIIETNKSGDFKKRKLSKIYYLRKYTETPSELQQSQKIQAAAAAPAPAPAPVAGPVAGPVAAAAAPPVIAPPVAAPPLNQNLVPKVGGLFSTSSLDSDNSPTAVNRPSGSSSYSPSSTGYSNESIANKPTYDAEPFISSLIKFTNAGFPSNSTVKSRLDTFFNIKAFRAYLKKLGEPITLFDKNNKTKNPSDIKILGSGSNEPGSGVDGKKRIEDGGNKLQTKPQNYEALIGSVYAFLFTNPSEQEKRQQSESSKTKTLKPSLLMVKDGDEYSLLGSKIDNQEKQLTALGASVVTNQISKITSDNKINKTIEEAFTKKTGTTFPGTSSDTRRTLVFEPKTMDPAPTIDTKIDDLMAIINSGQVDLSKMNSIIQSSKNRTSFGSGDLVLVPIIDIYNVVKGNVSASQIEGKISISPRQRIILKLTIELLQKQNILPTLTGEERQKDTFHTDKERMVGLADLSPATISELNSTVIHNIKFILNIIFSNKTTFLNGGTSYIIDYVDWNNTFKQLKDTAIQKNMKVGYYIEIELFIEKFDKGKLPINRADSFLGSCTVKRARLNSSWKRDFLNQNWGQVAEKLSDAFKPDPNASIASAIAGIIPNSIRKTLLGSSRDLMPRLNAGVNQISFVQYTFLGQDELIKAFKLVDNSYAGVAWKNNQAWEKRKERLFGAVDSCDADVYCFQNVQCSINVYKNIVKKLSTAKQDALKSTDTSPQTLRMNIYKNDIQEQLLSDTTDPTNLVAQIYEKYKDYYHFVYFFEQKCIIPTQLPSPTSTIRTCILEPDTEFPDIAHPTAVGNLTMIKKLKFEIKEIFDIRMAPVLFLKGGGPKGLLESEPFKPLWYNDKSFASITYCSFIGKGASIVASPGGISMGTTGVISKPKLPGIQNFEVKDTTDENSGELKNADEDDDRKDDNGEDISESQIKQIKDEIKEDEKGDEESDSESGDGEGGDGKGEGVDSQAGGNNQEWYEKDDTEEKAYGLISGKKPDNIEETKPVICEKYFDVKYIPIGQIFGIINVTLDAENTANAAAAAAAASATGKLATGKKPPPPPPPTSVTQTTTDDNKPLSKEAIEVLLIAALIYRFRLRYLLAGSTDNIPVFLSGDFNFDDNNKDPLAKQLLEIRSREFKKNYIPAAESNFKPYGKIITDFIYQCNILDYLYGGILRTGRFKSTVIPPRNLLEGVTFPLSRTTEGESFNTKRENQLIFKTRRLVFCPDEIIDGMEPMDHNNNFPDFPDNINPSNSNAIGGIFNIETQAVKQHISTVNSELKLKKQVQNNEDIKDLLGNMGEADEDDDGDHDDDGDGDGDGDGGDGDEGEGDEVFSNTESSDGKPEKIIPAVIKNMKDTTYSKQKSFFTSPYPKFVDVCQSGNTDYNYLTTIPMNQWKNGSNQFSVYSDHAPVKFSIDSDIDPSNGKHSCGKALGGGAQVGGGLEEMEGMEGGGLKDINLISWNIANICFKVEGSPGKPGYQSHKFVCDPAKIDCEETPDQYNRRLTNIASALEKLMSNNYKYTLIQEGPFFSKDAITKSHITTFINSINSRKSITVHQANIQSAGNTYYSQFYIVTRKDDKDVYDSMGLISLGNSGKKLFSGFTQTILTNILSLIHIDNYSKEDIAADFSKIWFFINQTQKIILIPVHLPLPQTGSPIKFISQRQQQIYSFMNAIVTTIRRSSDSKITQYKDYDIVFSGDFNINMIQKFPSDMIPTFLKCSAVSGQETIIYTNKDNAPSSFGGDNKGEFNPTNIDFAVYYPKVTLKATTKPAKPTKPTITTKPGKPGKPTGPSSSSSSKIPTVLSTDKIEALSASKVASVTSAIAKVNEIPYPVEQEIFKSNPDPIKAAMLKNNVSIIGTDYNKLYLNIGSGAGIMPPGSASLINISGAPIYDIQYDVVNSTSTTLPAGSISSCVNFMIQASPAQSGSGGLITRDTVANSIMNSLILAAQNGAKNVIIPFIGGGVFLGELQRKLGSGYSLAEHAKILVKGVTRYFEFVYTPEAALLKINAKSIETILFCPFNSPKVDEKTPLDDAIKAKNFVFTGKCNVITTNGSMNIIKATIAQCNSGMKNIAIVNAANVELEFGTGIASMCYAAINKDKLKQVELRDIRKQFVIAYKNYTAGKKASPGPSPGPSPPASPSKLPGPPGPLSPVKLPGSSPPASPSKPPGKLPGIPAASPAPSPPASPSKPPGKLTFGPRATVLNFLNAQAGKTDLPGNSMPPFSYTAALNEIKAGKKKGHWIWYIIPSDIHKGSTPTSVFYGIGPNADIRAKRDGVTVLSAEEYLNEPTLRQRYIEILTVIGKSVYDKFGKYSGPKDTRPQDFLINLMGGRTDYDKLTSSFRNLYYIIARKPHSGYLDNLHNILDGFYRKENGITSDMRPISPIAAPIVAPLPAPIVPKVTTVGARIVSLQQITDRIISASKSKPGSIFLINGGSFNPPHIGHIKTFELAYQQLMRMDAFKDRSVYGIMVAATNKHIVGKNVPKDAIISPENRIQLCQLAADSYAWKNPALFGQNNMLIYNTADDHPAGTIIYHIQGIDKKINNMYYLSGSDFYINTYLISKSGSPYNIMYVMRKEDITKSIQPRKNGQTQIQIVPKDKSGVAFDLSSSVIRQQINSLVDESNRKTFQRDIYNEVGRGVYCRLQQMNYIQPGKLYGDLCSDKGVGMMGETGKRTSGLLSTSPPSSPPSSPERRPQVIVSGDLLNRLSHGLLSERDIPENERPGLDLRLHRTFDNIDNTRVFNVGMNDGQIRAALVNIVNKIPDPGHNVADYVPIVRDAIQAGDIRFFNDLYYFFNTLQDMDPASARRRRDNTRHLYNCLNDLRFISRREFNDEYLRAGGSMNQMYLSKLNESQANIARSPNPDIRFKVLNYLLFKERYSVYLYLLGITPKNDNSFHGLGCGETLFNEYKLYVESQEGIGYQRILDIIRYRFMRARGNGNCYYNSIGMLTASPDVLRGYEGMSHDQKEAVQQQQQTRVRTQLAEFMRAIWSHIGGSRFDINQYERNARSRGAGVNFQSGINNIRFLLYVGSQNFRPISEIDVGVSPEFHGGETEMAFTSLFFHRPILTVSMNLPNGDQAGGFDARYFERYAPPGYNSLSRFMTTPGVTANQVVDFIVNQGVISVLSLEQGSQMIIAGNSIIPPQPAMILVGGQGHWDYAIPNPVLGASIPRAGVGLGASVRSSLRSSAKKGGQTSNITKKNKSSIRISVNKKTRKITKTTTRNNNSPKNKNKKKTQHFKIVRNGNNTRKKAK